MNQTYEHVLKCYDRKGLEEALLRKIQNEFYDRSELRSEDFAPIDEFHIRGREATVELTELLGVVDGLEVLDVGCGLGGTARYLAANFNCRVTGIDLTPTYISLAQKLSQKVDLAEETRFQTASALEIPFVDELFEVVWMEHVQMNIPSKKQLAIELARSLHKDGRLVLHEIFSVAGAEPHFPVPWADESFGSFLVTPDDFHDALDAAGLELIQWREVTQISLQWFENLTKRMSESGPPPLGIHLLMGEQAKTKLENVGKNLQENRICVVQAVYRKR